MDLDDAQLEQEETPENSSEDHNMASLLEQEGLGIDFPRQGEVRDGVVASITENQILISIGAKSEGLIRGREFENIPEEIRSSITVGQGISVYIVNPEDAHGNLILSFTRAVEEANWEQVEELWNTKEPFHTEITGYNKGGLIAPIGDLRGFVPASQISLSRRANLSGDTPEDRWGHMVDEEIAVCVIEVDRERRRLILSERAASTETRESLKEKVIIELKEGDVRTGRVASLADFGAFVNISGADGLVHLSEISWDRIQNPSEVLKVGQEVDVKVINVDRERKRIGLSIRRLLPDPWLSLIDNYKEGQLIECKITRLTKFGAFARIDDKLEGLVHISEISERRIEHPKEVLGEGDEYVLRIIKIDPENHRIGLSLRKVESMAYADQDWKALLAEMEDEGAEKVAETEAVEEAEPEVEETVETEAAEDTAEEALEETEDKETKE